jgi:branched-subunit amino acid transport protein
VVDDVVEGEGRPEHRWPAVASIVVALTLYALLPSSFLPPLRYGVVAVCLVLLVPIIVVNPVRLQTQTRWSRLISLGLAVLLAVANTVALVQLVVQLVAARSDEDGTLLLAAAQVWGTHIIVYALIYWEMDRGGPVTRTLALRKNLPDADIRFPQDEDHDAVIEVARGSSQKSDWTAGFVDYLYYSATNTMAFSPPDAMPLTLRAKLLAGFQAMGAYVILVLVIARAVSLLG